MSSLQLLREQIGELDWVEIADSGPDWLEVDCTLKLPDGTAVLFGLRLDARNGLDEAPSVRESRTARLPDTCPMRHINGDGTFCLGWGPDAIAAITNPVTSIQWWAELAGFLDLQNRASSTRRWPTRYAWPHGPGAAQARASYERLAQRLPMGVVAAVESRGFVLKGRRRLRQPNRPCPCGRTTRVRKCHGRQIIRLVNLQRAEESAEAAFWRRWKPRCCQTMKGCPIAPPGDS